MSLDAEGNVIDAVVVSSGGSKLDAAAGEVVLKFERHPPEGTPDPA